MLARSRRASSGELNDRGFDMFLTKPVDLPS